MKLSLAWKSVLALIGLSLLLLLIHPPHKQRDLPPASYTTIPALTTKDGLGDFVKVALSFKHIPQPQLKTWPEAYQQYYIGKDYAQEEGLKDENRLTNLHMMPLVIFLSLISAKLMNILSPTLVYFVYLLSILISAVLLGKKLLPKPFLTQKLPLFLLLLSSYPFWFMFERGNIWAAISGLSLAFSLLAFIQKKSFLGLSLIGLAICIRPNAAILYLIPLLLTLKKEIPLRHWVSLVIPILITTISWIGAHSLYESYTPANFLKGLHNYYVIYVLHLSGIGGGSSLFGPITLLTKKIYGLSPEKIKAINLGCTIFGAGAIIRESYHFLKNRVSTLEIWTLTASIYTLISTIFADYHLLIFAGIVWQALSNKLSSTTTKIILLCSLLILAPKQYVYFSGISIQVFINPMIIMGLSLYLLFKKKDPSLAA